jgi:hypothetical protein
VVADGPSGGADNELTIERRAVNAELGPFQTVYRTDDGRIFTFDEAFDELTPQMAEGLEGLPPEDQVINGGDVEEFLLESGIYELVTVEGRIVTQYTDGRTRWTNDQLREQVFPISDHGNLSFEDWRAAQVDSDTLTAADILQYVGYEDEGANEETVLTERLIID